MFYGSIVYSQNNNSHKKMSGLWEGLLRDIIGMELTLLRETLEKIFVCLEKCICSSLHKETLQCEAQTDKNLIVLYLIVTLNSSIFG